MMAKGLLTAAVATLIAAPIAAEPVKAPVQPASQPAANAANVVLAAAELPQSVETAPIASDSAAPPPARKRAARVTTCRCGDSGGQR